MYPPPPYTNNGFKDQPYPPDFINQPPSPQYTNNGFGEQPYAPGFINQPPPPPAYYTPPGPQANPMVLTTGQYVVAMPQRAYRDYMALSIFTLVACSLPSGIFALLYSTKAREALRRGDLSLAACYSASALRSNIVGMVIGCFCHVAWIAYVIYFCSTSSISYPYNWHN